MSKYVADVSVMLRGEHVLPGVEMSLKPKELSHLKSCGVPIFKANGSDRPKEDAKTLLAELKKAEQEREELQARLDAAESANADVTLGAPADSE